MSAVNRKQTLLGSAFYGEDGVISFNVSSGETARLVYSVAQQAMLGRRFKERYPLETVPFPFAEYFDIFLLSSPEGDEVAQSAANWLLENVREHPSGEVTWPHVFDFVFMDGACTIPAPWSSGIGQAMALLASLHWWRHTGDEKWKTLAMKAVIPFIRVLSTEKGIYHQIDSELHWFEEYPSVNPTHILNCHLLSLIALDYAERLTGSEEARAAFSKGFKALKAWIKRYDREIWSRYDQTERMFLFLRLVPSVRGEAYLGKVELSTAAGVRFVRLDAAIEEASDLPVSRPAGIDWGVVADIDGRPGRRVQNRQDTYRGAIPHGGTDQNTYLIFDERIPYEHYGEKGLVLSVDACLTGGAELTIEFRDPREEGLVFIPDPAVKNLTGDGWTHYEIDVQASLIGQPLPLHYHRFNTELLGTLVDSNPDTVLEEIFYKWHKGDLYNIRSDYPPAGQAPAANIFVFVNDKCGLACKMCDFGVKNEEAALTQFMTGKEKEMDPEALLKAISEVKDPSEGLTLRLTGTEPLFYEHYPLIIREARKRGLRTGITTNGLALEKEAASLVDAGLDELTLSIDGPPEIHDAIRGSKGLFSRVLKGVEAVKKNASEPGRKAPDIHVNFTISRDNHLAIMRFFDGISIIGPRSVSISHLNFVSPEVARKHNALYPSYRIAPSSVEAWTDALKMDFYGLFWQLEAARRIKWTEVMIIPFMPTLTRLRWYYSRPDLPMSRSICAAPWFSMQILSDGTVAVLGRCFDIALGDLKEKTLEDVWTGVGYEKTREFLKGHGWLTPCLRCCGSL